VILFITYDHQLYMSAFPVWYMPLCLVQRGLTADGVWVLAWHLGRWGELRGVHAGEGSFWVCIN
jgi:hypothetical protein